MDTQSVERQTQPIAPPLLLTTLRPADHHSEAMRNNFYFSLDNQVTLNMTSCMYMRGTQEIIPAAETAVMCLDHAQCSLRRAGELIH